MVYSVTIDRDSRYSASLYIKSYNVIHPSWINHASSSVTFYDDDKWFIILVNYSVIGNTITINAYVYNETEALVSMTNASITSINVFRPMYIGVIVDGGNALYDDFSASMNNPSYVLFTGLSPGMIIELWDDLGNLVSTGIANISNLVLSVVTDPVLGRGIDRRIVVKRPDNSVCAIYEESQSILGGDTYVVQSQASVISK